MLLGSTLGQDATSSFFIVLSNPWCTALSLFMLATLVKADQHLDDIKNALFKSFIDTVLDEYRAENISSPPKRFFEHIDILVDDSEPSYINSLTEALHGTNITNTALKDSYELLFSQMSSIQLDLQSSTTSTT